ncbi:heparan-alpha-glucosaminide N-acetyltransferase-like protein [Lates japonicus]|uniref:Heparan-alpha-glucosaminide N-acetyltransferase-like protein n=1 Tax=Lates japonicus TaxID=270547 RepID=A0AAD3R5M9_LATJO|nr:heparan-alpha-glucosaminide N-acetyltransferase-like protein [Lates japonicus]
MEAVEFVALYSYACENARRAELQEGALPATKAEKCGRRGISAAILSKCTRDGGFIPVNKNLWSLSYVTCMGCFSFLLLGGMYFVTDIKGWWGGQPFIYPGMNSILVYVGHSLLGFYFPFSWEMRIQQSHWEWLFQSLWGTALWVLIAYLLYRKKFFLKI